MLFSDYCFQLSNYQLHHFTFMIDNVNKLSWNFFKSWHLQATTELQKH